MPNWYVTEAFSLYSDIARCHSPTPRSCTDSEEKGTILPEPCSGVGYVHVPINTPDIEQAYRDSEARTGVMHVAVKDF